MFVYSIRDGYRVGWLHGGYVCGLCLCTVSEKAVELAGCMGGMFVAHVCVQYERRL